MIEKLSDPSLDEPTRFFMGRGAAVLGDVVAKLNEVIEAVNRLEERPVFTNPGRDPNTKNSVTVMKPL